MTITNDTHTHPYTHAYIHAYINTYTHTTFGGDVSSGVGSLEASGNISSSAYT